MFKTSILLLASILCPTAATAAAASDVPLGQLPRNVVPERYALELRIDPRKEGFSGKVGIDVQINESTQAIFLHGRDLEIDSATLTTAAGESLPLKAEVAHAAGGVLRLTAPAMLATGKATLTLVYHAEYGQNLQGAYRIKAGDQTYIATQMEPLGARSAFPGFDEPAFKTAWDISLVVPRDQNAVANTALVGIDKVEDGWQKLRFATTEKLPSYLIAFAVGPWELVEWADIPPNAVRTSPLKLRGIAAKGHGKELDYALQHSAEIVAALEEYFDYPYPFDKLDILAAPDFSAGAMENAGLIVYRDMLLLGIDKAPTRTRQAYWNVHAHELAHQWFGNLVTMPWWDDIWLNEAFATWMATKIVSQLQPEFHADRRLLQASLGAMGEDSLASTRRIHEPVHSFTDVESAFDGITYQKGGAMLSMFESFLGEEKFRAAIRQHMRQFARGNATSLDLMRSLAAQGGQATTLQAAFASFTDQPGVPFIHTELRCDGAKPRLLVQQKRYLPLGSKASDAQTWNIPMCVRYPRDGKPHKQCALVEGARSDFVLEGASCPAWVHPNADGAGYYRFAPAAKDQAALTAAFAQLDEREQLAYVDSLNAAFHNGSLSTDAWLDAVPAFAVNPVREVALAPVDILKWLREHIARDPASRSALDAWIARAYAPALARVGLKPRPTDDDETRLLRQGLIEMLVLTARDPELRSTLAAHGRRVLGADADGALDLAAIESDRRAVAIQAVGATGGKAEFELIEKHFRASEDALLRRELLSTLALFEQPELAARARALVLDPALRTNEVGIVLFWQMAEPALRDDARTWLRDHFEAVFKRVPKTWQSELPGIDATAMCDEEQADGLHSRYAERFADVEGGPRALAQAEEGVRLCASLRAHHARSGFGEALRAPQANAAGAGAQRGASTKSSVSSSVGASEG
jgi:cytosol alanyl aminopeptidase